ncbi:MAG: AbrB/MazE/SpoVT family DNA-binding domain-containing protein [Gemmatimonadota bacterium]|nr:AbrB/MazE/SpoVT family DNA-binding domain-containing protein [Gemmatimonadota bacterium]MDQ8172027.1 AbrB/MazE/SpoVT family DNA-binding domain-containing protein [Gemmatimonadota bacterium]
MKAKLVRIGNSRGVRLAKPLIEEAGLTDDIEIRVQGGALIITSVESPRAGWAESVAKHGPSRLLDEPSSTAFDETEWAW